MAYLWIVLSSYFVEALELPESQLAVAAVPCDSTQRAPLASHLTVILYSDLVGRGRYLLMMCSAVSAGILADALLKRGVKLLAVRQGMTLVGL